MATDAVSKTIKTGATPFFIATYTMECPKRCPKSTRCNKKLRVCEPKTLAKCKKGTNMNSLTHHCDPPVSKISRCYKGTKRNPKNGYCENVFIKLCNAYIMDPKLDRMLQTTWLTHQDCNIFTIGERHGVHTQCTAMLTMFKQMISMNNSLSKPVRFDILIEFTQEAAHKFKAYQDVDIPDVLTFTQMNRVRHYFNGCLQKRNCPVRVHWVDPTLTAQRLPNWLDELSHIDWGSGGLTKWTMIPAIREQIETESDVLKLLTENAIVMKEIEKASKVNPKFNLAFCKDLFMKKFTREVESSGVYWFYSVHIQLRYVMDFYAVARIIKLKMKEVVFYAGNLHVVNIIDILNALNFKMVRTINGECIQN